MGNPIHKSSLFYILLRNHVDFFWQIFYRRKTSINKHNVPKKQPVIFAANHQNTLMDALAIIFSLKGQTVFMARADIFKNKFAAAFLRKIKILPIFRIRDGIQNLSNNDDSFGQAVSVLEAKKRLALYPEGSHLGEKRLRAPKKGLARVAFQAEAQHDFKLGVKIVPTGIDFSHYINFRSDVLLQYGEPIMVADYKELYEENEQKAMSKLMEDVAAAIKPLMLHIDDAKNYKGIHAAATLSYADQRAHKKLKKDHLSQLNYYQKVSDKLVALKETQEETFQGILENALILQKQLKKFNLRSWVLAKGKFSFVGTFVQFLVLLLGLPFFMAGTVYNAIPFFLSIYLSKGVKDPQFISTFRFIIGLLLATILYFIYALVLYFTGVNIWLLVGILLAGIPAGLLAFAYYRLAKHTFARIRFKRLKSNKEWKKVCEDYQGLIQQIAAL